VNATGPWLENILGASSIKTGKKKPWARAMNLITKKRLCQDKALGLEGSESYLDNDAILNRGKRLYFFVPWRGYTMIGTDYKLYHGEAGEIRVTIDDIKELVEEINRIYPSAALALEDITFYHAGLVPVEHIQTGSDDIQLDKCSQIIDHDKENDIKGLYSIKGIKYTTAVETAKKLLKTILHSTKMPENPRNHQLSHTKENKTEDTAVKCQGYKNQNGNLKRHFESTYGESCTKVSKYIESNKDEQSLISLDPPLTRGEVRYFVREEMAAKLPDVVFRRTGLGSAECPAYEILKETADVMAEELGWSSKEKYEEIEAVISRYSPLKSAEILVRKQ
jgi:glycerol-3-phosphate dehydrogenase